MEFKKTGAGPLIWIGSAGFLALMTAIFYFKTKEGEVMASPAAVQMPVLPLPAGPAKIDRAMTEDEDLAMPPEMREQMEKDRDQQRQIKMLKMQLEQVNLQLENEKAITEINKLKKENATYVKDAGPQPGNDFPSIRVIYIGGGDGERQAILSIDGTSFSVKAKDRPLANIEILDVTDSAVKVRFSAPRALTATINYVQE